jgi:hypothetical protein
MDFLMNMQERGVDLLLVDSGDIHHGTGLADGGPPGSIDAHEVSTWLTLLFSGATVDPLVSGRRINFLHSYRTML